MKKLGLMLAIVAVASLCGIAQADTAVYSLTITNAQPITYSDALPVSGYLDRVTVVGPTAGATCTVTVAQYDGTTAVDTYVTGTALAANKMFRPRFLGTGTTGTDLAGATNIAASATTVLVAPYERALLGGNTKVAVTSVTGGAGTVTVTLFYEPVKK